MTEEDFMILVGRTQEAALGLAPWRAFGEHIRRVMDCSRVTLLVGPADGNSFVDEMADPAAPEDSGLAAHYRRLDPALPVAVAIAAQRANLREVAQYFEMVPEREFRRSEYFADYARETERFHRLGFSGLRGHARMAPFALHRPERSRPFSETDRQELLRIKPFVKCALAARERAGTRTLAIGAALGALDTCAEAMLVVDGDGRLVHCNAAAERRLQEKDGPLRLAAAGRGIGGGVTLSARRHRDADGLGRLIQAVAVGGRGGGACRLASGDGAGCSVSVVPLPARLMDGGRLPGAMPGLAMVTVIDLRRRAAGGLAGTLATLFGLSRSEAAVAQGLAEGLTAEQVAAARCVSLDTVRSQIRSVLRKVGAAGLRDLERIMALLPRGE